MTASCRSLAECGSDPVRSDACSGCAPTRTSSLIRLLRPCPPEKCYPSRLRATFRLGALVSWWRSVPELIRGIQEATCGCEAAMEPALQAPAKRSTGHRRQHLAPCARVPVQHGYWGSVSGLATEPHKHPTANRRNSGPGARIRVGRRIGAAPQSTGGGQPVSPRIVVRRAHHQTGASWQITAQVAPGSEAYCRR